MKPMPGGKVRLCSVGALLLAVSCTSSSSSSVQPTPHSEQAVSSAASPATFPGRLLVTEQGKSVRTMQPDGTDVVAFSGTQDALVSQPTWSPDGSKVAWAQTSGAPQTVTLSTTSTVQASNGASLVTANPDGSHRTAAPTGKTIIYSLWDPTSSRVAFLANSDSALELGTVAQGSTHAAELDHGSPYYLSWSPDGQQILAHVANYLDVVSLSGKHDPITTEIGQFEAPFWGPSSEMFVEQKDPGCPVECLVNKTATSTEMIAQLPSDGGAFVPSSTFDDVAFRDIQQTGIAPLEVAHHDGSEWRMTTVTKQPALFFYWSPDGSKLLFATLEDGAAGTWLHWNVWDGEKTVTFGRFQPSAEFATNYIPFFTQYAQSMSLWSPDGSAFAYPGNDEEGHTGIWVQRAGAPPSDPKLVSTGDVVTWSPDAQT